jgi:hypothetical protein
VLLGFVYLIKSGRFYKIGRSNAVGRRERELRRSGGDFGAPGG